MEDLNENIMKVYLIFYSQIKGKNSLKFMIILVKDFKIFLNIIKNDWIFSL